MSKGLQIHWPISFTHTNFISSGSITRTFLEMSSLSNTLRKEIENGVI